MAKPSKRKRERRCSSGKADSVANPEKQPGSLANTAQLMTAARQAVLATVPTSFEFEGRTYLLRVQRIAMIASISSSTDPERPIVTLIADRAIGAAPGVPLH